MLLSELNKMLLQVADSNYLVNESFVGDVYTINSKENKFGCFVVTPMNAVKYSVGTIRYTYVLYYIDRLTKKEDNIDFVQTDGVNVLKGLITFLSENGVEPEEGYEFTLFKQKFSDWCAGAYVNVSFLVPDNDCSDNDFTLYNGDLRPLNALENGIYVPDGFDGYNRVVVNVEGGGVTPEWVDSEIDIKLEGYATQSWVTSRFVDKRELNDYATRTWVISKNYASESWVSSKIIDAGLGLQGWVYNQNYVSDQWVYGKKYATQSWVSSQQFATQSWVSTAIAGLAARSWVEDQGYLTSEALMGYATEQWVSSNYFPESQIWTGTQSEWDELSPSQQVGYTIALITE